MNSVSSLIPKEKTSNRILGIEGGRGLAACLVIFYHVSRLMDAAYGSHYLKTIFQFGHAGVDFFFSISGFIIFYVHYGDIGQPHRVLYYIGRRFSRLIPTYWVALSITIVMYLLGRHALPPFWPLVWQTFLLPSDRPLILGIAWTLQFEMLFYIIFCFLIINKNFGGILLGIWFIVSVVSMVSGVHLKWLPKQFNDSYVIEFYFGMFSAYIVKNYRIWRPEFIFFIGLFSFFVIAISENIQLIDGYNNFTRVFYGIPSAAIILGIVGRAQENRSFEIYLLKNLGSSSYSLYLFQFIFIGIMWQLLEKFHLKSVIPIFTQFLILSIFAIFGGVLMSNVVEHPLIQACRRRSWPSFLRPSIWTPDSK